MDIIKYVKESVLNESSNFLILRNAHRVAESIAQKKLDAIKESETLNEIAASTLRSYLGKAQTQHSDDIEDLLDLKHEKDSMMDTYAGASDRVGHAAMDAAIEKARAHAGKRARGIEHAINHLKDK